MLISPGCAGRLESALIRRTWGGAGPPRLRVCYVWESAFLTGCLGMPPEWMPPEWVRGLHSRDGERSSQSVAQGGRVAPGGSFREGGAHGLSPRGLEAGALGPGACLAPPRGPRRASPLLWDFVSPPAKRAVKAQPPRRQLKRHP